MNVKQEACSQCQSVGWHEQCIIKGNHCNHWSAITATSFDLRLVPVTWQHYDIRWLTSGKFRQPVRVGLGIGDLGIQRRILFPTLTYLIIRPFQRDAKQWFQLYLSLMLRIMGCQSDSDPELNLCPALLISNKDIAQWQRIDTRFIYWGESLD